MDFAESAWVGEAAAGRRPAVRRGSVSRSTWAGLFARKQANLFCQRWLRLGGTDVTDPRSDQLATALWGQSEV